MLKVKSIILKKIGRRDNWREVAFFMSGDETKFEVREYYGQNKMAYMKEVARFPFDNYGVATMNYMNCIRTREIDGYDVEHSLKNEIPCLPFFNFKPPVYKCDFQTPFTEQFAKINEPVVLPIQDGKRIYIKLGTESINSIKAVDGSGKEVVLSESLLVNLQRKMKISQLENGVIEAYIQSDFSIRIFDVFMLNGQAVIQPYLKRLKAIKTVLGENDKIHYCKPVNQADMRQMNARHFIVKNGEKPCGTDSAFVVPNFYSIKVLVQKAYDYRPGWYQVMFSTDEGYTSIGDLYSPHEELYPNIQIQIAFKQVENGLPVNFWLSPIQNKEKLNYDEKGTFIEQMDHLQDFWYGL